MRTIAIDVVMPQPALEEAEVKRVVAALEKQVQRDFAPIWNISAEIRYVGKAEKARDEAWQLVLLDSAGGYDDGYHELTRAGLPLGRVFLRTATKEKTGWASTASHEVLELLANPETTFGVFVQDSSSGSRVYSYEVCDPVQDDPYCYVIDGFHMSDFVYPAWFETWHAPRSVPFDHARKLERPFEVPKGCYACYYEAREKKWVDDWGGKETPTTLHPDGGYGSRLAGTGRGGSRRLLRERPRHEWRKSTRG
jgi:hypothetical protein